MCFKACWIGSGLDLTSKIMCCHLGCLVLSLILSPGCPGATFAKQAQGYLGKPHGIRYVLVQSYELYNVLRFRLQCSINVLYPKCSAQPNVDTCLVGIWVPTLMTSFNVSLATRPQLVWRPVGGVKLAQQGDLWAVSTVADRMAATPKLSLV